MTTAASSVNNQNVNTPETGSLPKPDPTAQKTNDVFLQLKNCLIHTKYVKTITIEKLESNPGKYKLLIDLQTTDTRETKGLSLTYDSQVQAKEDFDKIAKFLSAHTI